MPSMRINSLSVMVTLCALALVPATQCSATDLRLGIIGTDSSHAVEFTRILNDDGATDHVAGARIVAAFRGGNPSYPLSRNRIAEFTSELQKKWSLPFVENIGDLCPRVDAILLLSVDPSSRLHEFHEAAACHKPIFVDKPLAPTLADAQALATFAAENKVAWFSSSALRFGEAQQISSTGQIRAADVWGPGALGDHDALDLTWYGIHSIELLYALMGPGVKSVSRIHAEDTDVITALWIDGRVGSVRLIRPDANFGAVVFRTGTNSVVEKDIPIKYSPLLTAIVAWVRTGISPVPVQQTLEIFALMESAQESMKKGGQPVALPKTQIPTTVH